MQSLSVLCGILDGRRALGRMDTCICMVESLCGPPETVTIFLIDYTPMQNKQLKEKVGRHYAVLEKHMEESHQCVHFAYIMGARIMEY